MKVQKKALTYKGKLIRLTVDFSIESWLKPSYHVRWYIESAEWEKCASMDTLFSMVVIQNRKRYRVSHTNKNYRGSWTLNQPHKGLISFICIWILFSQHHLSFLHWTVLPPFSIIIWPYMWGFICESLYLGSIFIHWYTCLSIPFFLL